MHFSPPKIYSFPPFFTKQPHEPTWQKQLHHWCQLILLYCKAEKKWRLESSDAIFENKLINRSVKPDMIKEILSQLTLQGNAEWTDKDKSSLYVLWYTRNEWANIVLEYAENTGQQGNVLTIYELLNGDLTLSQEFHQMNEVLFVSILQLLVKKGRAQLLSEDVDGKNQTVGVKIV